MAKRWSGQMQNLTAAIEQHTSRTSVMKHNAGICDLKKNDHITSFIQEAPGTIML